MESRWVPTMLVSYHGGPLISNVQLTPIYDGNTFWNSTTGAPLVSSFNTAFGQLVTAQTNTNTTPFMQTLTPYNIGQYNLGTNPPTFQYTYQVSALGNLTASDVTSSNPQASESPKSIINTIVAEINNHLVPLPTNNELYLVMLPQGTSFPLGTYPDGLPAGTVGFHQSFTVTFNNGQKQNVYYANGQGLALPKAQLQELKRGKYGFPRLFFPDISRQAKKRTGRR